MKIDEYKELCSSLGLVPFSTVKEECDYGYYACNCLNNERFFSVCGYRAEERVDKCWEAGSLIFYDDNGFYRDEYYTDCEKAKPALIKEIRKFKQILNEYRKHNIVMDFV